MRTRGGKGKRKTGRFPRHAASANKSLADVEEGREMR